MELQRLSTSPDKNYLTKMLVQKSKKNGRNIFFPKMSKIHFPGLRTLRLAIWTTYFIFFQYFSKGLDLMFWTDFGTIFPYFPFKGLLILALDLKVVPWLYDTSPVRNCAHDVIQSGLRLRSTLVEQGSRVLILFFGKMSRCLKKVEKWSKNICPENV